MYSVAIYQPYYVRTILHVMYIRTLFIVIVRDEILEGQNIGKCMLTNLLVVINWQIASEYCLYKYCISGAYIINSYGVNAFLAVHGAWLQVHMGCCQWWKILLLQKRLPANPLLNCHG